jgi:alpha-L-rhamnosidase
MLTRVYPVLSKLSDYVDGTISPTTGLVPNLPATNVYSTLAVLTRQNVLGVNVFRRVGAIAAILGRPPTEVATQRHRQAALTAAINNRLTRPDGTYVDGLNADGTKSATGSQESNVVAVAYEVVPGDRQAAVAAYVARLGMASPPRDANELLATMRLAGRPSDFVERVTDTKGDGWANILSQGGTFTWEVWEPSDANGDSMSHGWGSTVLVEIQRELLGVVPTGPGFASFDVAPPPSVLTWASGQVPTPRGPIAVSWQRPTGVKGSFTLDVVVPPNATATVRVPAVRPGGITEGGHPLKNVTMEADNAVVRVGAGHYHFVSSSVPPDAVSNGGPGQVSAFGGKAPLPGSGSPGTTTAGGVNPQTGARTTNGAAAPAGPSGHHHQTPIWWEVLAAATLVGAAAQTVRARRTAARTKS